MGMGVGATEVTKAVYSLFCKGSLYSRVIRAVQINQTRYKLDSLCTVVSSTFLGRATENYLQASHGDAKQYKRNNQQPYVTMK